jgi:hypothetical protein
MALHFNAGLAPLRQSLFHPDFSGWVLSFCLSMIFSENRIPLFGIMLQARDTELFSLAASLD